MSDKQYINMCRRVLSKVLGSLTQQLQTTWGNYLVVCSWAGQTPKIPRSEPMLVKSLWGDTVLIRVVDVKDVERLSPAHERLAEQASLRVDLALSAPPVLSDAEQLVYWFCWKKTSTGWVQHGLHHTLVLPTDAPVVKALVRLVSELRDTISRLRSKTEKKLIVKTRKR